MLGRGLYAILDLDAWGSRGVDLVADRRALLDVASALLRARPSMLQLRAKHAGARDVLALLRALAPAAAAASVPLVANDRIDLALLAGVPFAHLGQDDLPLADARRIAPSLSLGRSTHDAAQLAAELAACPAYVAFGPVFTTTSKRDPSPTVGLAPLAEAARLAGAAGIPLVAIGGITRENVAEVVAAGVRWAAVISDLVAVDAGGAPAIEEIERRARVLDDALRGGGG
jgi:thiamine-phosphate pyrophosphorylase